MVVSKLQLDALFQIKQTGQAGCDPALLAWLVAEGLVADDLIGLALTGYGEYAIKETQAWQARMQQVHADTVYAKWLRGE